MLSRPKRKAAGPKNYSDAAHESILEDLMKPVPAQRNRKRPASPAKPAALSLLPQKPSGKVPYNWLRPPSDADIFSRRLNLAGAYVDTASQILHCPGQPGARAAGATLSLDLETSTAALLLLRHMGQSQPPAAAPPAGFHLKRGDFIHMVSEPPGEPYYVGRIMGFKRKPKDVAPAANGSESGASHNNGDSLKGPQDKPGSGALARSGSGRADAHPESHTQPAALFVFQIQWFYRPRDISKHTSDSRVLFASMHSDTCPLSSFRGVVTVRHKTEVEELYPPPKPACDGSPAYASPLEYYCSLPNHFYFDKLFDRYMIKFYDIIKTSSLLPHIDNAANNSKHYLLALNKRFEYIFMEASRTKQFLNNFNSTSSSHCEVCAEWCSPNESVDCAGCAKNFHMLCLDPPLLKKPSRGFSWSCAVCTKKHELEHRSKKTLMLSHDNRSTNESELSITESTDPTDQELPEERAHDTILPKYEIMAIDYLNNDADVSFEERRLREEWPLRYLGKHTRLEDAVDPDDRSPYPRACTNLGARFQASNIPEFEDHPILYYDPETPKERTSKLKKGSGSKTAKKHKDEEEVEKLSVPNEYEHLSPKDYPSWLQRRPKGYIERGEDDGDGRTCTLMWKAREEDKQDNFSHLDAYVESCKPIAEHLGMLPNSPNFVDAILKFYLDSKRDTNRALSLAKTLTKASLREPAFSKEEIKRFESGVRENGSELFPTYKKVKTQPCAMIVRFYYLWKKTEQGRLIWGNFPGRKKKAQKEQRPDEKPNMKVTPAIDDFADSEDDSSYENEKIVAKKKMFQCKHCQSYQSYKWFKITGHDITCDFDDTSKTLKPKAGVVSALCFRCAKLWRRYAVYWEDPQEIQKRNSRGVGGYRKKVEPELIADSQSILEYGEMMGGLCYDINIKLITSSVITPPPTLLKPSALARAEKFPKTTASTETKPKPLESGTKSPKVEQLDPKAAPRLTSRQLSLSTKQAIKTESSTEEPAPKKRKPSGNGSSNSKVKVEPKEKVQHVSKKKIEVSKPTNSTSTDDRSTTNKRKRKAETEKTPNSVNEVNKPSLKPPASNSKKQRKVTTDSASILNPIFNHIYREELPKVATVTKIDKRLFPVLDKTVLEDVIDNYKLRQLTDMKLLTIQNQTPSNAKVEQPYNVTDRDCCVCLDKTRSEEALQEMLICTNCGVNVHASCTGITLFGKQKPIKQWLCDPCTNDLSPNYSSNYSCCLCLANELNYEGSILGSPKVKPDYLVPILDSGKWCHLLCAMFSYKSIIFRNLVTPAFVSKEVLHALSTRCFGTAIESVSNVYLENYSSRCGICGCFNGALVQCDMCEVDHRFHVTCAQDTDNFKLGFKLATSKLPKTSTNSYVEKEIGKLEPILVCSKHADQPISGIRDYGRRTPTGEQRPLVQLFLEDISKSILPKLNGPQLKARNYISMIATFMEKENAQPRNPKITTNEAVATQTLVCMSCGVKSSPCWWSVAGSTSWKCQNCHFNDPGEEGEDQVSEGSKFKAELEAPLGGQACGISDMSDVVSAIHQPPEPKTHEILTHLESILSCT